MANLKRVHSNALSTAIKKCSTHKSQKDHSKECDSKSTGIVVILARAIPASLNICYHHYYNECGSLASIQLVNYMLKFKYAEVTI